MEQPNESSQNAGQLDQWLNDADEFARRDPTKAVISALGAGFLFNLVPIGAIIGVLLSIVFALLRPALFVLGAFKAYELCRTKMEGTK